MNYKKRSHQGKFKPSKRQKVFYLDEVIKPHSANPSPNKYKTSLNLLESTKKNQLKNKVDQNVLKNTYIDQIENEEKKRKTPGIGKYNLLTLTDFKDTEGRKLKNR